jgi:hypothetical protein
LTASGDHPTLDIPALDTSRCLLWGASMAVTDSVVPPGPVVVVGAGLIAVMVSATPLVPRSGRISWVVHGFCYIGTWIHELGHAAACVLTGGGVYCIELHTPDSGVTYTWFPSWWSSVVTGMAGYAMPPLMGVGAASLISHGHSPFVLMDAVGLAVLALPVSRDLFTLAVSVTIGGVSAAALAWGPIELQHWLACTAAWLLLLSELPSLYSLLAGRFRGTAEFDDAQVLTALTHIPGVLWIAGWTTLVGWGGWTAVPLLWR